MIFLRSLPLDPPPPVTGDPDYDKNVAAWWALQPAVGEKYPKGHFVGLYDGQVVADAATLDDVLATLRAIDDDPRKGLVARVGIDIPQEAVIWMPRRAE
jgi:hypothetical protein